MTTDMQHLLAKQQTDLRDFGLIFARLIAGLAVDPHGYFEKKYIARIEHARSDSEINGVLAQLMQWVASSSVTDAERDSLDKQLTDKGLPRISDLRSALLP